MRVAHIAGGLVATAVTGALVWLAASLGPSPPPPWKITARTSAHRTLVVEVETRNLTEALTIAREIGEPLQSAYDEILVYFHGPGSRDLLRRVQWTPAHGYVETVYGERDRDVLP
jgi:hypothetical protein